MMMVLALLQVISCALISMIPPEGRMEVCVTTMRRVHVERLMSVMVGVCTGVRV
jgi:hypothetical protein